MLELER
jgi:hypothetical protein